MLTLCCLYYVYMCFWLTCDIDSFLNRRKTEIYLKKINSFCCSCSCCSLSNRLPISLLETQANGKQNKKWANFQIEKQQQQEQRRQSHYWIKYQFELISRSELRQTKANKANKWGKQCGEIDKLLAINKLNTTKLRRRKKTMAI